MKYLFFTHTPAQVHQYRRAVARLRDRGHDVLVLAPADGRSAALLDSCDLPHAPSGRREAGTFRLVRGLPRRLVRAAATARRFGPDCVFGRGLDAAVAGAVARAPVVLVADSSAGFGLAVSAPFADAVLTPHTVERDFGENHYEFRGFAELAAVHPDEYDPDPGVRDELGVDDDEEFVVVRFEAGDGGSRRRPRRSATAPEKRQRLVDGLSGHATVFLDCDSPPEETLDRNSTPEATSASADELPASSLDLPPESRLDALAEASLVVSDDRTTVTGAALLGTPAIHTDSYAGDDDLGDFVELERHGLAYDLRDFHDVLDAATDLLGDDDAGKTWAERRDDYLADAVNPTAVLVGVAEAVTGSDEGRTVSEDGNDRTAPGNGIGRVEGVSSRGPDAGRVLPFDPELARIDPETRRGEGGKP